MSIRMLVFFVLLCTYHATAFTSGNRNFRFATTPLIGRPTRRRLEPLSASLLNANDEEDDVDKLKIRADELPSIEPEMLLLALAPPITGLFLWGGISRGVAYFFDAFNKFQNVDGNRFAADILRPTINGIVVPATSIVLGTLFATTVNVLWNRQLQIRSSINKEVGELRLLRRALFGCFGTAQHSKRRLASLNLTHGYVRSLILETKTEGDQILKRVQERGGISMNQMDELADMLHGVDGAAASRQGSVSTAASLLVSLNSHRSERVATTLSDFPTIHWLLLFFLYLSIVVSFFIDSNQGVLQYLNSFQLRILFSLLLGIGSGSLVLLKGLEDPFEGPFSIQLAAMQLDYFDELLVSDMQAAKEESAQAGPSALVSVNRDHDRPNYNTGNTLYFHLLTGPWSSSVKVAGELYTWTVRKLSEVWGRVKRRWRRK